MLKPTMLGVLLLLSCRADVLSEVQDTLTASPLALDFGTVTVGGHRTLELRLEGRMQGSLRLGSPFSTDDAAFTAPTLLRVTFAPTADGEFSSQLEAGPLVVLVRGEGRSRTACESVDACVSSRWSDDEARCITEPLSEGAACISACVASGQCQSGQCVGSLNDCDDRDVCTLDACDATHGCTHSPKACASSDPCLAARCDPLLGCVTSAVEDGVSCGARDCSSAKVCRSGSCIDRPSPDGSACGAASICRSPGVCTSGACVQPAARQLQVAWTRSTSGLIDFPALADAAGNSFWFECPSAAVCTLVSVTSDGALRYEVPTAFRYFAHPYRKPIPAILAGELIVFSWNGELEAHRRADGAFAWKTMLPYRNPGPNAAERREVFGLAARLPDALYAASAFFPNWGGGDYEPTLSRLDLRTGQLEWDQRAGSSSVGSSSIPHPSVVVDATGQPVVGGFYPGPGFTRGFTEAGLVRWSSGAGPIAVTQLIGDRVFHSNMGWFDAQGQHHAVPRFQNIAFPSALATDAGVVLVGVSSVHIELMNESTGWQRVPLLDFGAWPPRVSTPGLSSAGAVAFAHQGSTGPRLYDFAPDGTPIADCPFTVGANQIDLNQPLLELPGKVLLVDSGRKVVWAFTR